MDEGHKSHFTRSDLVPWELHAPGMQQYETSPGFLRKKGSTRLTHSADEDDSMCNHIRVPKHPATFLQKSASKTYPAACI